MINFEKFYKSYLQKGGQVFVTMRQPERYHEYTFEEIMEFKGDSLPQIPLYDPNGSYTYFITPNRKHVYLAHVKTLAAKLSDFNERHRNLFEVEDRHELYNTFYIPKKTRGFRRIDAPNDELKAALVELKNIFETSEFRPFHASAYAYVEKRCTKDALVKHQKNNSNWFGHFDFHDFFGSTTLEFVMDMLSRIFPYSLLIEEGNGEVLRKALSLGFLDGGLPQGTPLSPFLTNLMMIPFDHIVTAALRKFPNSKSKQGTDRFVYTRYADDIHISCVVEFNIKELERFIVEVLKALGAPFSINAEKTHYNSRAGKNFMLGLILNKDNEISVGYRAKKQLSNAVHNYMMDRKNDIAWEVGDLQTLCGKMSYVYSVEPAWFEKFEENNMAKYGAKAKEALESDLSVA